MIFSSITFLFYFLPATLLLYFLIKWKNLTLLIASLLFYAWGEIQFVIVMLLSCIINYALGILIDNQDSRIRKYALTGGIIANLALLVFFKYAALFVSAFNQIITRSDLDPLNEPNIHLPLGISFFTFQAMSYLIDVYRREAAVEKNPLNLALYIAMFPQLIAGPIVRYRTIAGEIRSRTVSVERFVLGTKVFTIGLAQKVLIANTVAASADKIFALPAEQLGTAAAWLGALCYTFQIYFDFGGYSNMAIGLGLMVGFHLPKNFNYPYIATSITDFWRRWHITLSRWFKDYLYIPLGGNRHGAVRTYFNLWVIFALCGLWHGASWTFVIWGCYHGIFMVLERAVLTRFLSKTWRPFQHLYTLLIIIFGWVLFRCETFAQALIHLRAMTAIAPTSIAHRSVMEFLPNDVLIALIIGSILSTPIVPWIQSKITAKLENKTTAYAQKFSLLQSTITCTALATLLIAVSMTLAAGAYNPFIYFRF